MSQCSPEGRGDESVYLDWAYPASIVSAVESIKYEEKKWNIYMILGNSETVNSDMLILCSDLMVS